MNVPYKTVSYGEIRVAYTTELSGGGMTFGQAYIPFLREHPGPVDRTLEWCAGPGFIGFSLLANGLTRSIALADRNPAAVAAARTTVQENRLEGSVDVYLSDCFDDIPSTESFDLIIGNPPHSGSDQVIPGINRPPIIYSDPGWAAHRRFYQRAGEFLRAEGSVILQENSKFSTPDDFDDMITQAGLRIVATYDAGRSFYFLWVRPSAASREPSPGSGAYAH